MGALAQQRRPCRHRGVASQPWGGQEEGGLWEKTAVRTYGPSGAGALLLCSQTGGERQTGWAWPRLQHWEELGSDTQGAS